MDEPARRRCPWCPADPALDIEAPQGAIVAQKGDRLFIHFTTWPMRHLRVRGLVGKVLIARLLRGGSGVTHATIDPHEKGTHTTVRGVGEDVVTFTVPIRQPDVLDTHHRGSNGRKRNRADAEE